jgi:hypothetical protein
MKNILLIFLFLNIMLFPRTGFCKEAEDRIVDIPDDCGKVIYKTPYKTARQKEIICILDAHCNYDAQKNIAGIIDHISKKKGLAFVAIEGSSGVFNLEDLSVAGDERSRRMVLDYYLKSGFITGPEYYTVTANPGMILYGVEEEDLYRRNYESFNIILSLWGKVNHYITHLDKSVNELKKAVYSEDMLEWERTVNDYDSGNISLVHFLNELVSRMDKAHIDLIGFPGVKRLKQAVEIQNSIVFDEIAFERKRLVQDLGESISPENMRELVSTSLKYRLRKIDELEYVTYLIEMAEGAGLRDETYLNLITYVKYLQCMEFVNSTDIISELKKAETEVTEKLIENDDQRRLRDIDKKREKIKKALTLDLSRDEAAELSAQVLLKYLKDINKIFSALMEKHNTGSDYQNLEKSLFIEIFEAVEDFYTVALDREKFLVNNTIDEMDNRKQSAALFIVGGFHKEGIIQKFEGAGARVTVILPRITENEGRHVYFNIMNNPSMPLQAALDEEESTGASL